MLPAARPANTILLRLNVGDRFEADEEQERIELGPNASDPVVRHARVEIEVLEAPPDGPALLSLQRFDLDEPATEYPPEQVRVGLRGERTAIDGEVLCTALYPEGPIEVGTRWIRVGLESDDLPVEVVAIDGERTHIVGGGPLTRPGEFGDEEFGSVRFDEWVYPDGMRGVFIHEYTIGDRVRGRTTARVRRLPPASP